MLPSPKPVKPVVLFVDVVIVPAPEVNVHFPVCVGDAVNVAVPSHDVAGLEPALATNVVILTVLTDAGQVPLVTVHVKRFVAFAVKPLAVAVGDVAVGVNVTPAADHAPVPNNGVVAFLR